MSSKENLSDLQELVFKVRYPRSKELIEEAIEAYYGGAYRACIMSVWIAVSFDILEKLKELATYNDSQAQQYVDELNRYVQANNVISLSKKEQELLKVASEDFELISREQAEIFERLKKDRNLCAHPSYTTDNQIFNVSPEQARMYISYAVLNLLSFGPVRGKSSIQNIAVDIVGDSFPYTAEDAGKFLDQKYLKFCKPALLENLIKVLLKALVKDNQSWKGNEAKAARALKGISIVKAREYENWMRDNLSRFCDGLSPEEVSKLFSLLVIDQRCWDWMADQHRLQLIATLEQINPVSVSDQVSERNSALSLLNDMVEGVEKNRLAQKVGLSEFYALFSLLGIEDLKEKLLSLFDQLSENKKGTVIKLYPHSLLTERAIDLYSSAGSFRGAEAIGQDILLSMAKYYSKDDVRSIFEAILGNGQIYAAGGTEEILMTFFCELLECHGEDYLADIDFQTFISDLKEKYDHYDDLEEMLRTIAVIS